MQTLYQNTCAGQLAQVWGQEGPRELRRVPKGVGVERGRPIRTPAQVSLHRFVANSA